MSYEKPKKGQPELVRRSVVRMRLSLGLRLEFGLCSLNLKHVYIATMKKSRWYFTVTQALSLQVLVSLALWKFWVMLSCNAATTCNNPTRPVREPASLCGLPNREDLVSCILGVPTAADQRIQQVAMPKMRNRGCIIEISPDYLTIFGF